MPEFKLAVNEFNKATELPLLRIGGTVQQNPHMRAFWGSTCSFFLAFMGWFALAPVALDVAHSMEICENQKFPPSLVTMENLKKPAFLKFKNLKTSKTYCRFGKDDPDKPKDCKPVPADEQCHTANANAATCVHICGATASDPADCVDSEKYKYNPEVLSKCVCSGGTECKSVLANAGIASVSSTIFVRVALGTLLERFGPVNVQSLLLTFGATWVALSAAISAPWNFTLIRFFIGCAGATFVTNQFWCSFMFAPNIVGTANATAAGWGNLGGGVTQVFVGVMLMGIFEDGFGLDNNAAWRVSMLVPAFMFIVCAAFMKLLCWDTPLRRRFNPSDTGKTTGASMMDYVEVLKDFRVWVMIFQYSACFGTELAMNNQLATHFRSYFQMKAKNAAALASSFGGMNLFARSLGGIFSDFLFARFGFRGRIWAQFLSLFFEALFLFAFGCVGNDQEWYVALAVLICFSIFVQMAEGTSYGIVPFMNPKQLAVISALVGAGGNLGAVIAGSCFYKPIEDELTPFKVHAGYVMFWALLSPVYWWPQYGGMFSGPSQEFTQAEEKQAVDSEPKEAVI